MNTAVTEFDVFFLSYDEPNAEKHWANLLDICPWAKRVHGVKGFDSAHRACAESSETDWFVTVDADNIVRPEFFDLIIEVNDKRPRQCWSWDARNFHNGLRYGNGGVKLWSRDFVLNMNTHENSDDPRKAVDFCWEDDYQQVHRTFSDVYVIGSPYQAFRVGYREGVKLTLDRGKRVHPRDMRNILHRNNLRNAKIWASVGADTQNGLWAMLGTRMAWNHMCEMDFDHTLIRDYAWFDEKWRKIIDRLMGTEEAAIEAASPNSSSIKAQALLSNIKNYGENIEQYTGIALQSLDARASAFFKECIEV